MRNIAAKDSKRPTGGLPQNYFFIENLSKGQKFSFLKLVTSRDVTRFCQLSGDNNPLHMEEAFAKKRGFKSRVVHGFLLTSYVSRMIGVFLPGRNCLLLGVDCKFLSPCYVGDTIEVTAVVDEISIAVKAAVLRIVIINKVSGKILAKGKTTVGFTNEIGRTSDV